MQRAPSGADWLFNLGFFVVMNTLLLVPPWLKSRRAAGPFRWLYFAAVAPLVILVWGLSWQWLFDVTAGNLWPLSLVVYGFPCFIAWLLIAWLEERSAGKRGPLSR